jgi:hypothetical protein
VPNWWIELGVPLIAVVLAFVLGVCSGTSTSIDTRTKVQILGAKPVIRGGGMLLVVAGLGIPFGCLFVTPREVNDRIALGVVSFSLVVVGAGTVASAYRDKIVLSPDGIGQRTWHGKPAFIPWCEVDTVDQATDTSYVVRDKSGTKIVVPGAWWLDSLELFVKACREHLQANQYPPWFALDEYC